MNIENDFTNYLETNGIKLISLLTCDECNACIHEIVEHHSYINLDECDVEHVCEGAGQLAIAIGKGEGEMRLLQAFCAAKSSISIPEKAARVMIMLWTSSQSPLTIAEVEQLSTEVNGLGVDEVIWGAGRDESLDDMLKVTLVLSYPYPELPPACTEQQRGVTTADVLIGLAVGATGAVSGTMSVNKEMADHQFGSAKDHSGYHSVDKDGNNTGIGYSFEDLHKKALQHEGKKVTNGDQRKNGYDFKVENPGGTIEYQQLKTNPNHLYDKNGDYRYKKQTAVVPKGEVEHAKQVCEVHGKRKPEAGEPVKIIDSPVSRNDAERNLYRGLASVKYDINHIAPAAIGVGLATGVAYVACKSVEYAVADEKKKEKMHSNIGSYIAKALGVTAVGCLLTGIGYICHAQLARPTR